ncbi:serine hydrolase [Carnobacteriaceae bacterium zg-ZUI78]|uniref:serine hydrolase n=1 Tax=Granulicatella sp. zg-84 TaxID=2678503 RepID=UPI0013C28911|nr:serine hydrolase [Granulicatella sp. zg-84]MBS4750156.1 serine hydrolase [Carnobacteriaceae bacterium zg-ZUI78]NEW65503.1 D-alanyl-D-alanine carboxypeptidase [Granulicatella sp. zg-84]QMI85612.1 serine hydrolase [Carnobacteriaceae bacterium zg-84]
MLKKKKIYQILSLSIVLTSIVLIYLLFLLPATKQDVFAYTWGDDLPLTASLYLDHAKPDTQVEIDKSQLEKEGLQTVNVVYEGKTYRVKFNINKPDISTIVALDAANRVFYKGQNYQTIFKVNPKYASQVTYNKNSQSLSSGEERVCATAYGQESCQVLTVADKPEVLEGLVSKYDYVNKDLVTIVREFLADKNVSEELVSFAYKSVDSDDVIAMNKNAPMKSASTYKLPLNMLVSDKVKSGNLSLDQKVPVCSECYESIDEYRGFLNNYGQSVDVKLLQEESIVNSSNVASLVLFNTLGGVTKVYEDIAVYGQAEGDIKTIASSDYSLTTSDYFIQVLNYLYKNQNTYADIIAYMKKAMPGAYLKKYVTDADIAHKYGDFGGAHNDVAIVYEKTPYLLALYTTGVGLETFEQLAFVINQYHITHQK